MSWEHFFQCKYGTRVFYHLPFRIRQKKSGNKAYPNTLISAGANLCFFSFNFFFYLFRVIGVLGYMFRNMKSTFPCCKSYFFMCNCPFLLKTWLFSMRYLAHGTESKYSLLSNRKLFFLINNIIIYENISPKAKISTFKWNSDDTFLDSVLKQAVSQKVSPGRLVHKIQKLIG